MKRASNYQSDFYDSTINNMPYLGIIFAEYFYEHKYGERFSVISSEISSTINESFVYYAVCLVQELLVKIRGLHIFQI